MKKAITKALVFIFVITVAIVLVGNRPLFAEAKPINLLFATFDAPFGPFSKVKMEFAKEVEEKTGGRVKVQIKWVMGKPGELFELTEKGVVDIGWDTQTLIPGLFPLTEIFELPFIIPTAEIGAKAIHEYMKRGFRDKAYDNVKLLWTLTSDAHNILAKKKAITKLDDFKGMKLGVGGTKQTRFASLIGAVPVFMPMPEMYSSLQKGIIDATIFGFPMLHQFRLFEVGKYVMGPPMITGQIMCPMNKGKWNSLPADIQKIIDGMSYKYAIKSAQAWDLFSKRGQQKFLDTGGQMNTLSQEELNKLSKAAEPIWDEYINEITKKGFNGKKAVDDVYNILKELGVENPAVGYKPGR